jgi:hypothetical protein
MVEFTGFDERFVVVVVVDEEDEEEEDCSSFSICAACFVELSKT